MARFDTSGLDDVIRQIESMEDTEAVTDRMLLDAAEEVKKCWRQAMETKGLVDTYDMWHSVGYPRKPRKVSDVKTIDIYPQGRDRKGVRNAEKAFINHYGTSKGRGIKATLFVDLADELSAAPVERVMTEDFNDFLREKGLI